MDETSPRLSWQLSDTRPSSRQTGYQIVIAQEGATVFDSGVVWSSQSIGVTADGLVLEPATRYDWQVTVWDGDGRLGETARSWFETGLLSPAGWASATWIEHDPAFAAMVDPPAADDLALPDRLATCTPARLFRRTFTLREAPSRARLYISARGIYRADLNGSRVGSDELAPGWTDYRYRIQYQTYDITGRLQAGKNVVGVQLADGWWSGYLGFDPRHHAEHYGPRAQLIAMLVIHYGDGSSDVITTDSDWRETDGPTLHSDLLMGEVHDARLAVHGWAADPGLDDSSWRPVALAGTRHEALIGTLDEPVRVIEERAPVSVRRLDGERLLFDLGQNLVGRVRLSIQGAAPATVIRLRHAEVLDAAGELYTDNLRTAEATDIYVCGGGGSETFEPAFTVHGFRYVEVTGHPDVEVTGLVLHSDFPMTGAFTCSDPDINQLWSNIVWGQRGNFVSVPTDCPQRDERLGWLADAQVFLPTACYNADVAAFFSRWMRDVLDGALPDGAFPDVAPFLDRPVINREGAPGWGDAGVIIPWHLYRTYGDLRVMERSFPAMTRWIDRIVEANPDLIWRHLVGNHYGDWLHTGPTTPREVLSTAYLARSTRIVAEAAEALGLGEHATRYGALAEAVRTAFHEAFVAGDGSVKGGTQTCYAIALSFGLVPDDLTQAAVGHLVAEIDANNGRLSTGFLATGELCPVLAEHDRADVAYQLLHQTQAPSWLHSVRQGATTIWERWDGLTDGTGFQTSAMNSFNHYAFGSIGAWLYSSVAGIGQAEHSIAFSDLVIAPIPGGTLTSASACYDSPRGPVAVSWQLTGGRFDLDVTIPPGTTATVHLPGRTDRSSREITSGTHHLSIPYP